MDIKMVLKSTLRNCKLQPVKWFLISLAKCLLWLTWVAVCIYAIMIIDNAACRLIPQLLLGAAFAHGVELQHHALHHTGYPVGTRQSHGRFPAGPDDADILQRVSGQLFISSSGPRRTRRRRVFQEQ
ncbi:hypothetical protein ACL2XP_04190 [Sodalis sp. RH21]|uniref:hypothetical protein n=1 Tax=unclassified Sodalis (in: enterobacteria) TaxID=2636512 RepID=UPI0039B435BC